MNLSRQSAEIIQMMKDDATLALITRKSRDVQSKAERELYCHGACVGRIERGREVVQKRYHGRVARIMIDEGALEPVGELPHQGMQYRLSELALSLPQSALDRMLEDRTRIMLASVNAIAKKYGVRVHRIVVRKMYYLEPLAGQKLQVPYMPYHPDDLDKPNPRLVTKINDLTYDEWERLIIETIRRNPVPGVTDDHH